MCNMVWNTMVALILECDVDHNGEYNGSVEKWNAMTNAIACCRIAECSRFNYDTGKK